MDDIKSNNLVLIRLLDEWGHANKGYSYLN